MKIRKSFIVKVMLILFGAIAVSNAGNLLVTLHGAEDEIVSTTESYMKDITVLCGEEMENILAYNPELLTDADTLGRIAGDVHLDGIGSSYAYIVDDKGTMLYHPTTDKIGQSVENDAVKQILESLNRGNHPEPHVIKYDFKGVAKYAAVYVGENEDFIAVVTADESEMLAGVNAMRVKCAVFSAVILIVLLVAVYAFLRMTLKYLKIAKEDIAKMADFDFASYGDEEDIKAPADEIGDIIHAVITTRKRVRMLLYSLKDKSDTLTSTIAGINSQIEHTSGLITQVESAVDEIAQGATNQAEETQESTNSIMNIGDKINRVADQAEKLKKQSAEMDQAGSIAMDTLNELTAINESTKTAIDNIYRQTLNTNDSADKINAAIDVITDIADQTSLLSLNASIEAAHAGDAGKGFAVVASHIKELSEQSNKAAVEISEIIKELVKNSNESVKIMDSVNESMSRQTECLTETKKDFACVSEGITSSVESMNEVTDHIEQMNEEKNHIVDAIQDLTAIAEENAAGTEETSASAAEVASIMESLRGKVKDMNELSDDLNTSISRFKV